MKPFQSVRNLITKVEAFRLAHSSTALAAGLIEYSDMQIAADAVNEWLKQVDADPNTQAVEFPAGTITENEVVLVRSLLMVLQTKLDRIRMGRDDEGDKETVLQDAQNAINNFRIILDKVDQIHIDRATRPKVWIDPDRLLSNYKTNQDLLAMINEALHGTKENDPSFTTAAVNLLDQAAVQLSRYNFLIDDLESVHGAPFRVVVDRPEIKFKVELYERLVKWLKGWTEEHKIDTYRYNGDVIQQIAGLIVDANDEHKSALARYKRLVDDLTTYLRACVLVAEGVGKGGTHHIKEIRLESLIEQIETVIQKLRDEQSHSADRWWRSAPDLFRNEYPVLEYIHRARRAEEEAQQLRDKYEPKPKEETAQAADEYQF